MPQRRQRLRATALAAVVAGSLALSACGSSTSPPVTGAPSAGSTAAPSAGGSAGASAGPSVAGQGLAPQRGVLIGAWAGVTRASGDQTGRLVAIRKLEQRLGRQLDIVHNFYAWDDPFDLKQERMVLASGQIPLISWNGTDTADINAGHVDKQIARHADAVARLGERVLLRWFWEMDGVKKRHLARSPEQYVAAWHRVRRIFAERGATNVEWVWCPNAFSFANGRAQKFYPGPQAVDWVCADGYDNAGDGILEPFAHIFADFYKWADHTGKPVMIGEFGIDAKSRYGQPAWIADAHRALATGFPRTRAIVFFDAIGANGNDWRVRSDRGVAAMRQLVHDPYFHTRRTGSSPARPD